MSSDGQVITFRCGRCSAMLPAEMFTPTKRKNGGYCKSCCAEHARERRVAGGEALELQRRCARYGLTVEEYNTMLLSQMGRCLICGAFEYTALHIDHDEKTGKVRGLLCGNCNRGIGCLGHDVDRLASAMTYLLSHANLLETETS